MSGTGRRDPSAIALRRLQSELREWQRSPPEGCSLLTCDPLTVWVVSMKGPESAPAPGLPRLYNGETFRLRLSFPDTYPIDAPEVVFLKPVPIHPHIYEVGHICLDILYAPPNGAWSPAMTASSCCLSLRSMLASCTEKVRPVGDAQYSRRNANTSPKNIRWLFHDDKV